MPLREPWGQVAHSEGSARFAGVDWEGGKSAGGQVRAEEYRLRVTAPGVPAPCEDVGLSVPEGCTCLGMEGWRDGEWRDGG